MTNSLTEQLKQLSSAEDFLTFFGVSFEPAVVQVSRLHILKRFYQYIRQEDELDQHDELSLYRCYRELLSKAYGDFVQSTPAKEKVFKVFQEADGTRHVSLQSLKASLPQRPSASSIPHPRG